MFAPTTDPQERRARLWALLRTRALYRRVERRQRTAKSEIVERRHWLSLFLHDLKGQVAAIAANVDYLSKFGPGADDPRRPDFEDSVEDTRGVFEQLKSAVRTVLDYDRFETGQLVLREGRFSMAELAGETVEGLRRHASLAEKTLTLARPAAKDDRPLYGDSELVSSAMLNLAMGALRRSAPRTEVAVRILATDTGMQFRVDAPGGSLQPGERLNVFEPYGRQLAGAAGYGLGLALARAVVELHEGRIWVEDRQGGGCVFVFELGGHTPPLAHTGPPSETNERGRASEVGRASRRWRREARPRDRRRVFALRCRCRVDRLERRPTPSWTSSARRWSRTATTRYVCRRHWFSAVWATRARSRPS